MINLLPPSTKENYRYARRNTSLRRWITLFGWSFVGLMLISLGGVMYLHQQAANYTKQNVVAQQTLSQQKQKQVEKQVQDISSSLKLAVQVLSKEVLFSRLLKQLAVTVPSNASLSNLSISQLQSSVDITAKTTDYNAATQLQINLTDPSNQIFTKADIVSISCGATTSKYACTVVLRALFATNNPFLFINNSKPGAPR